MKESLSVMQVKWYADELMIKHTVDEPIELLHCCNLQLFKMLPYYTLTWIIR